jgi:hypothetical protein
MLSKFVITQKVAVAVARVARAAYISVLLALPGDIGEVVLVHRSHVSGARMRDE